MNFLSEGDQAKPKRYVTVLNEIEAACREVDRDVYEVTLVTVTKTADQGAIEPVLAAGQRIFGENRVQEAKAKWPELLERFSDISLHLIGPVQSNKARDAVAFFDVIQTVDRSKLCEALAKEMDKQGRRPIFWFRLIQAVSHKRRGSFLRTLMVFLNSAVAPMV